MLPCIYDDKQHEILESEVARWCRRNAPADWKDRLFTYRHQLHDTFVVAVWAGDKYGLFSDVLNLGHSFANFDRRMADELRHRMYAPTSADSMAKQINQVNRDFNSRMQDKNAALQDENERRQRGE
jgi:hypothetical protein